jgi:hypothetical protein
MLLLLSLFLGNDVCWFGLVWFGSSSFLEGTKEDRFKIGLGQVTRLIVVVCIHTTATGLIGLVSEVV